MKNQALVSLKDKSKKLKCLLLQFLFGALRVNRHMMLTFGEHPIGIIKGDVYTFKGRNSTIFVHPFILGERICSLPFKEQHIFQKGYARRESKKSQICIHMENYLSVCMVLLI